MRQRTDYKIIKPTTTDKAIEVYDKAENFISKVQDYLNLGKSRDR